MKSILKIYVEKPGDVHMMIDLECVKKFNVLKDLLMIVFILQEQSDVIGIIKWDFVRNCKVVKSFKNYQKKIHIKNNV